MDNENQTKSSISTIPQWIFKTLFASLMIIIPFKPCCQMENLATSHCGFKIVVFYPKFSYIRKMKKGPKTSQWQNSALCTMLTYQHGGSVLWTRRQLWASHNTVNCILLHNHSMLLPSNTKAPYLHLLSVFYHRELNSLREWLNYHTF